MKKVLVIAYYWPPAGGPGVQRVLKFVKYLPEFGWQPVVMTVDKGDYPALDPSLVDEVPPETRVYRIPIWEPYAIYRRFSGKASEDPIPVGILAQKEELSFSQRAMHWIRANLFVPDARAGWYRRAVGEARRIIEREGIDLIFVSSPPHSLQLIGRKLRRIAHIPLISDLRDPWTDIHYYQDLKRLRLTEDLDRWLERRALSGADLVVTVSPGLARHLTRRAGGTDCRVVYNGFDASDFEQVPEHPPGERRFSLAYIGNLKANQNPPDLWLALRDLLDEDRGFAEHFRLALTGTVNADIHVGLRELGLAPFTVVEGYVPHREAIARMRGASVLLFIVPQAPDNLGILTGKLFDYLAAGRPFLSVGPPLGDAAALLSATEAGPMYDYGDRERIKQRVQQLYRGWRAGKLAQFVPSAEQVERYERRALTGTLADLMCDLVSTDDGHQTI